MRLGFVSKEGFTEDEVYDERENINRFCDENFEPILREEEILEFRTEIEYELSNLKDSKDIFYAGEGKFYRTNKRLIFIREPNVGREAKDMSPLSMHVAIPRMMRARDMIKIGAKEYMDIPLNEIKGWRMGGIFRKYVGLYIFSNKGIYIVYFFIKKDIPIEKLLGNYLLSLRVKSLRELEKKLNIKV